MAVSNLKNTISIIEQGTETVAGVNWTYRKWSDGTVEGWCKNASSAGVGAGYNPFATRLPDMFIQAYEPICTFSGGITGVASSWVAYQRAMWSVDHWYLDGYIGNGGGATSGAWFYVHAIGKWK